jgi:hypothetical protein
MARRTSSNVSCSSDSVGRARQHNVRFYDDGGMPEVRFFPDPFFFCRVTLIGSGVLARVSIDKFCTCISPTAISGCGGTGLCAAPSGISPSRSTTKGADVV